MLNKLDILSGVDPIRLCVAYELDGRRVDAWPSSADLLVPRDADLRGLRRLESSRSTTSDRCRGLPDAARRYVTALEEYAGAPIVLVSVGPERTQTIERAWRPIRHRTPRRRPRDEACADDPGDAADPDPDRRRRRAGARAGLEAGVRPGRERRGRRCPAATRSLRSRTCGASRATRSIRRRSSAAARSFAAELVVIGPEAPLAAGVADALAGRRDRRSSDRPPRRPGSRARRRSAVSRRGRGRADGGGAGCSLRRTRRRRSRSRWGSPRTERSSSRPMGLRRARASRCADRWTRPPRPSHLSRARSWSRSVSSDARRASWRSAMGAMRSPCRSRGTTSGSATATRDRTPAAWAPYSPLPDLADDDADGDPRPVPPADPRRAGAPRDAVPRALCTPG